MKTYFLDQGEFVGGAECFLIDFFNTLEESDCRQMQPEVVGGKSNDYKNRLKNKGVNVLNFLYPSVKGGVFAKALHSVELLKAAKRLTNVTQQERKKQFFSNTPRTHFVMHLAKKFFRIKGRWIVMFHDFTVPNFLVRSIGKRADVLVANSMATRNYLRKILPEHCYDKIRIVENGIDFSLIPSQTVPRKIEKILVLGRIDPRKGQLYALKAAKKLQADGVICLFDFVGGAVDGDTATNDYFDKCKVFAGEESLRNIRFLPEIDSVFEKIKEYDLVLFLPTEPETFGRVVTESLAMGKMVLSFDQTGPRDILQNFFYFLGRNGQVIPKNPFLIPPNNALALAKAIKHYIENPNEAIAMCMQARSFVEKNYNLKETKKRLMEIL